MEIKVVDNRKIKLADVLNEQIQDANYLRFAVAFAKNSGFQIIKDSLEDFLGKSGKAIFLIGLDFSSSDPNVLRDLFSYQEKSNSFELLCYRGGEASEVSTYHPKVYLINGDVKQNTAIVGSSNLTRGGLISNTEANILISSDDDSEIFSDLSDVFLSLRLDDRRVIPNYKFIDKYEELFKLNRRGKNIRHQKQFQELLDIEKELPRSNLKANELSGWMKLVYEHLPEGLFENAEIYEFEKAFKEIYPENRNIKAKIRQQLQYLEKFELLDHPDRNQWKKKINKN